MQPDEALYLLARDGDLAAFETLYARYERRLFGFLLRLVNDRAEAEELFHAPSLRSSNPRAPPSTPPPSPPGSSGSRETSR